MKSVFYFLLRMLWEEVGYTSIFMNMYINEYCTRLLIYL